MFPFLVDWITFRGSFEESYLYLDKNVFWQKSSRSSRANIPLETTASWLYRAWIIHLQKRALFMKGFFLHDRLNCFASWQLFEELFTCEPQKLSWTAQSLQANMYSVPRWLRRTLYLPSCSWFACSHVYAFRDFVRSLVTGRWRQEPARCPALLRAE